MIRRWVWLFAIAVLVAGCDATSVDATSAHARKPAVGWVRSDLKPVTQPELAGGLLVLYAAAGGGLQVLGLDPKTGRTVWHDSASPADIATGEPAGLGVAGSTVAFLSPVDNSTGSSQLVGVDAATGRVLWRTPTGLFTDWPGPCADDHLAICTTVFTGQQTIALRARASDGRPVATVPISSSAGGFGMAPDLYVPVNSPEMLLAVRGASVAWTRTLASVFPLPGVSTRYGWDVDEITAAGLYVGSVGAAPVASTSSATTYDLSRTMTAGFRISDGATVWRDPGTMYACGLQLPCPGVDGTAAPSQAPTIGLRLRVTGTETVSRSSAEPSFSPGTDMVVEGFSLATGKTVWSYNAGRGFSFGQVLPLLGRYVAILPAPGGGIAALNLTTGARSPIPAGAVAWCLSYAVFKTQVGWAASKNGPLSYERLTQEMIKPCHASGASVAAPAAVPGFVGTVVDGLTAWSESSEVAAAPTSS